MAARVKAASPGTAPRVSMSRLMVRLCALRNSFPRCSRSVASSVARRLLSVFMMPRMSPAISSEIVVSSVASGYTASAEDRSPPPNG